MQIELRCSVRSSSSTYLSGIECKGSCGRAESDVETGIGLKLVWRSWLFVRNPVNRMKTVLFRCYTQCSVNIVEDMS